MFGILAALAMLAGLGESTDDKNIHGGSIDDKTIHACPNGWEVGWTEGGEGYCVDQDGKVWISPDGNEWVSTDAYTW